LNRAHFLEDSPWNTPSQPPFFSPSKGYPYGYEIELERINGSADHTSANLPSLTKGQRLKVPVEGELV
jgi:hypothetical protein